MREVLPGVILSGVQVSLQRLLRMLQVKGGTGSFDLSSAIVPMVDVTKLVEAEGNLSLTEARDLNYEAGAVVPHAPTIRWEFTMPDGTSGFLNAVLGSIRRATAGAPGGLQQLYIVLFRLGPAGFTAHRIFNCDLFNNTPGASNNVNLILPQRLYPGDMIRGYSQDTSTGGTGDYVFTATVELSRG